MRTPLAIASIAALTAGLSACGGQEVFEIPVGACMGSSSLEGNEVSQIPTVDCAEEHDVEAYASFDLTGEAYPGAADIQAQADEFCLAEFEQFVGKSYQESTLEFSYLHPTEESWEADDREVLCLLIAPEPVTGSLEGSAQ